MTGRLHTASILRLTSDHSLAIGSLLSRADQAISDGLATVERIEVHSCRSGKLES